MLASLVAMEGDGLPIEVIRLMLLAQRIENRCDSIMVDHVDAFIDLSLLFGHGKAKRWHINTTTS